MEKELVWAKMKGFPQWPGKICTPEPNSVVFSLMKNAAKPKGQSMKWIFFFGSKNYSWIEERHLKPYVENRTTIVKTIKNNRLMEAVKRIDEYLSDPEFYKANADVDVRSVDEFGDTETGFNEFILPATGEEEAKKTPSKSGRKNKSKRVVDNDVDSGVDETPPKRVRTFAKDEWTLRPQVFLQKMQNIFSPVTIFGFLGTGVVGSGIVMNLLSSGHEVVIWNRDPSQLKTLEELGALVAATPCEVAEQVDIIFSCVFDPQASEELVFGDGGIISSNQHFDGQGYIEMTGWNEGPSHNIANAIVSRNGRYLHSQIFGTRVQAEDGTLTILATGHRTLYDECQSCFKAMANNSFFLGYPKFSN